MDTSSALLLLLVLFFFVSGECASAENSEIQKDFKDRKHRADAEQDPYTSVTLATQPGDPSSTLFRSCLDKSRTFESKFASIDSLGGITYTRYVPDSDMLGYPVTWVIAAGSVSNIFDCVSASEAGGYSMFKYSANDCKLAKQAYDLNIVPQCEDNANDAVFIKPAVSGSCAFPTVPVGGGSICTLFTEKLMTYDAAKIFCNSKQGFMLYFNAYSSSLLSLANVTAKIQELGFTRNMWVHSVFTGTVWTGDYSPQDWVNGATPSDGSEVGYLDSQAGWKLRGSMRSALAGAVCIVGYDT